MSEIQEFRRIINAAESVIRNREREWKDHARSIVSTARGASVDEVVKYACARVATAAQKLSVPQNALAAETVPFYSALFSWGRDGFPHFSLSPDFFHAVAQTDFGDPSDEPLYMPFDAFTISFPKVDFFLGASKAFIYKLPKVSLIPGVIGGAPSFEVEWKLYRATLMTDDPCFTQWTVGLTRKQLVESQEVLNQPTDNPGTRPVNPEETPALTRLRTLLANVMSYVEAAGPLPTKPRVKNAPAAAVELTHPEQRIYDVGRTVKLDARIREALTHSGGNAGKWKIAQRFIVRGHWRNQAYGENLALRKRLWIEPFWKGGEDVKDVLERNYEVRT